MEIVLKLFLAYCTNAWWVLLGHFGLLAYLLYRLIPCRRQVRHELNALTDKRTASKSKFLEDAEAQIKNYAEHGREPDLPRIEKLIADNLNRDSEALRPLINGFIVLGLMGTLFSLYRIWAQHGLDIAKDSSTVLQNMGIAFSASFFGLVWALSCSVFLFTPLTRQTAHVVQEFNRRLIELSTKYPPRTPESTIEQIAEELHTNVEAIGTAIGQLREQEKENLTASRGILQDFRDTTKEVISNLAITVKEAQSRTEKTAEELKTSVVTTSRELLQDFRDTTNEVISNLAGTVENSQLRTEKTAEELKTNVASSLEELKTRFVEISESWRKELEQTIKASEQAAERLGKSSENLTAATQDVVVSLQAVRESLERTKDLAQIVTSIEQLTGNYLNQTQEQLNIFHNGLEEILDAARTIPDEWFTMLDKRNSELASKLEAVVAGWEEHVIQTSEELSTKFSNVGEKLNPLVAFLAVDGSLMKTLEQLHLVLGTIMEWFKEMSKADISTQVETLINAITQLDETIHQLQPSKEPLSSDGLLHLISEVEGIHTLLGDWHQNVTPIVHVDGVTVDVTPLAQKIEMVDQKVETLLQRINQSVTSAMDSVIAQLKVVTEKLDQIATALTTSKRRPNKFNQLLRRVFRKKEKEEVL
ncbi:hypothetical protein FJZ31_11090 [Candidatus Poribacteria bacterium]|nr:hypothetical protein [Candidatus Poribacteria bacterium]